MYGSLPVSFDKPRVNFSLGKQQEEHDEVHKVIIVPY